MKPQYKKMIIIGIIVVAAIVAAYFIFKKSGLISSTTAADIPPLDTGDEAAYQQMADVIESRVADGLVGGWLGNDAYKRYMSGDVSEDYKVYGQMSKAGALLQAYSAEYYGPAYNYPNKADEKQTLDMLWKIFRDYREKKGF